VTILIDNNDGFAYNLYQYLAEIDAKTKVLLNQDANIEKIIDLAPSHIVIGSGAGHPKDAKLLIELVKRLGEKTAILGIGLGHQVIGLAFGGKIKPMCRITHGKSSTVRLLDCPIFKDLPPTIKAGRYHSLIIDKLPPVLISTAYDGEGAIMALRHRRHRIFGLQFCPGSFLTEYGKRILRNFLEV